MSNELTKMNPKLAILGITLKPTDALSKPLTNVLGIDNIKELATPICGIVNAAVNKRGWAGYLAIIPDVIPAIANIDQVPAEANDMSYEEFDDLKAHIKKELDFEGEANAIEEATENIAVHILGIAMEINRLVNAKVK